ncbi:chemotaxis protein CheW [Siccirubricoccus sp. KC 17139]|uniref:Chemotaxis protein CheW n=1 Tax=Siccirubricoccus soli TaxID=2899147 RepID=A0ABT1D7P9_9PROT|nr:chemotaxis protein CheW [Siccirubricoccus soli]MCO6417948.1 chemotaxis protein CheW [Siccirubricoccus soli]MCP2684083.1 chemotaxis protein CheW [Siccirubricoccus soli]
MAPDSPLDPCWQTVGLGGDASCPQLPAHGHCHNCPKHAAAASVLLNRPAPAGYLEEWTGHVARRGAFSGLSAEAGAGAEGAAALSVVIFRLGTEWLALPSRLLEEVTEMRRVHSLPRRRSNVVLGVVNIHGGLLICVSLAILLGLAPGPPPTDRRAELQRRMLVIGRDSGRFVFPAEEVHGIQRVPADSLRPAPATVARAASSYTRHVLPWQGRSVGHLDAELLLDGLNRSIA